MKISTPRNWNPLWSPQLVILCGFTAVFWLLQASRLTDIVNITPYGGEHSSQGLYRFSISSSSDTSEAVSRKPRAILHIGPHKTSSTYIQTRLCRAQDQLAQEGFMIPIAKSCSEEQLAQSYVKHFAGVAAQLRGNMKMASSFGCSLNPLADLDEAVRSIYSENSSTGIILSSEEFDYLDENGVAELANVLSNYQTTVVIYYRRKLEHLTSYYTELSKVRSPLLSPSSLTDFFWTIVADLDPMAGPNDPVPRGNGLCYKRLFETYSRHFGAENLVVVYLNGLLDAGKDPWHVLTQEVMMLGLGKGRSYNNDEKDSMKEEEGRNKSPSAFSFSVADYFYQWRWGDYSIANATDGSSISTSSSLTVLPIEDRSSADMLDSIPPPLLPHLGCVLPLLKPLEEMLPKQCFDLQNVCHLWELQEQQALTQMSEKATRLLYFDKGKDNSGKETILLRETKYSGACQVDTEKLFKEHGKNAIATIPPLLQVVFDEVAATIDKTCPYDQAQIDPATLEEWK